LKWTGPTLNTTPDLAGFYVFRSADGEDPIKEVGLRNETFVSAELGVEHYYGLKSFDTSMNISPMTAWVLGTALPATMVEPGQLLFTRTAELGEKLVIAPASTMAVPPATPSFSASAYEIQVGDSVAFTNATLGADSYFWEFGDGGTSSATNPTHKYEGAGVFSVKLTAYNDWGEQFVVGATPITVNRDGAVAPTRITTGLQFLALFDEAAGRVVHDQSGVGMAYDLSFQGESHYWQPDGTLFLDYGWLLGGNPFSKVIDACKASNEITVEAWVKRWEDPHYYMVDAVVLANSAEEETECNFILYQTGNGQYEVKLRTSSTDLDGAPSLVGGDAALTKIEQVTYTRDSSGNVKLYIDAVEVASMIIGGDFSTWSAGFKFAMGSLVDGGREVAWMGKLDLVAIYSSALSQANIETNLMAGGGAVGPPPAAPVAAFSFANADGGDLESPAPLEVNITQSSTGNITKYEWDFGDGNFSTLANPGSHIYEDPGRYTPSLIVEGPGGEDVETKDEGYVVATEGGLPPVEDAFYVSVRGNDTSGDGSKGDPWRHIQYGIEQMRSGDTLYLRKQSGDEDFHEIVTFADVIGSANAWYTVRNYPGEKPVLNGNYTIPQGKFVCVNPTDSTKGFLYAGMLNFSGTNKYIQISGLKIKHSRGFGVRSEQGSGGHHIVLDRVEIEETRGGTLKIQRHDNVTLSDCVLHGSCNYYQKLRGHDNDVAWSASLMLKHGDGHRVERCAVYNSYGEGIHPMGWTNGIVQDCVIADCMNSMLVLTSSNHCTVERNLVYSTRVFPFATSTGMGLAHDRIDKFQYVDSHDNLFVNNICANVGLGCRIRDGHHGEDTFGRNTKMAHNTFVWIADSGNLEKGFNQRWFDMDRLEDIKKMHLFNNVFYQPNSVNVSKNAAGQPDYHHNFWSFLPGAFFRGTGDVVNESKLFSFGPGRYEIVLPLPDGKTWSELREVADQFKLRSGSAVEGKGQYDSDIPKDFWGNSRSASAPDMGANER
jgi:PKD repeat protein